MYFSRGNSKCKGPEAGDNLEHGEEYERTKGKSRRVYREGTGVRYARPGVTF